MNTNNIDKEINISKEIEYMAEYISNIWSLDKTRTISFINGLYESMYEDYKEYINSVDISPLVLPLLDKREAQLSNDMFTMIDSIYLFGRSLTRASIDTINGYDFEKKSKIYVSKSLDNNCFKSAKLKGWTKKLEYDLLEENEDSLNFEDYKGLNFSYATQPSFGEAVMPLNIAYANDRHGYGVKKLLEWACLTHLIELVATKNKQELHADIENIFLTFEDNYKDNLSKAIYVVNLEDGLKSNIGLKLAKIVKDKYNNTESVEDYNSKIEIFEKIKAKKDMEEQNIMSEKVSKRRKP